MNHFTSAFALRCLVAIALLSTVWLLPATISTVSAGERCFGASGQGCGGWNVGEMPRMAFCGNIANSGLAVCAVSGGSMTHDPCCADNPRGKQCGGSPENAQCTSQWDRAVRRAIWFYQWTRLIDTRRVNETNVVERSLYCAKRDSGIHKNDAEFCCSRQSREGNGWERIGRPSLNVCK